MTIRRPLRQSRGHLDPAEGHGGKLREQRENESEVQNTESTRHKRRDWPGSQIPSALCLVPCASCPSDSSLPSPRPAAARLPGPSGDQAGNMTPIKSGVDVDRDHIGRAAIEHPEQRRQPAEVGAVADARRHRDHRAIHQPPDGLRRGPLHAGDADDRVGARPEGSLLSNRWMPATPTSTTSGNVAAPRLGRDAGLLGDGQVAGAGGDDHDAAELRAVVVGPAGAGRSGRRVGARLRGRPP